MSTEAQNSPFIRQLASSDKQVRDEALKSLKKYLGAKTELPELDLLKLWKGLFYCLWMQDKPVLQQALSRDLASLVSSVRTPVVLPFLRAFWLTMAREWSHIEALRLDKYLYLIRQYLHHSFQFLSRQNWEASVLKGWNQIVKGTPLHTSDMKVPNGLRYHVLDIWVDELEKVAGKKWAKETKSEELEMLVEPIEELAKDGKLKVLRVAAQETLSDERLRAWRGKVAEKSSEEEDDGELEFGGFDPK